MSAHILARRSVCQTLGSKASVGRRSRPCKLVVKAYLSNKEATEDGVKETVAAKEKAKVTFQLPHHVEYGQDMCLIGEDPALGEWDISKCVPMAWHEGDFWTAEAELPAGAKVEYKYVIRAAEDMGGGVLEWQPCFNMQLEADRPEVTVRDAWEGSAHEILPGTLPIPVPQPLEEEQEVVGTDGDAVAAVEERSALEAAQIPVAQHVAVADTIARFVSEDAVTAEDVAAAAAPDSSSDDEILTAEAIMAAAVVPAPPATNGKSRNGQRRSSTASKAPKGASNNGVEPVGFNPAPHWESLATSQLKDMCKKRGLNTKGQRRDLLARLQQYGA